ncbi:MAG: hypothetical protein WAZ18_07230 [Alphaproteobacteria bacterium]
MNVKDLVVEVRALRSDLQDLKEELHRYKGFVGGVMWCMGALSAAGGFVWGLVTGHGG